MTKRKKKQNIDREYGYKQEEQGKKCLGSLQRDEARRNIVFLGAAKKEVNLSTKAKRCLRFDNCIIIIVKLKESLRNV